MRHTIIFLLAYVALFSLSAFVPTAAHAAQPFAVPSASSTSPTPASPALPVSNEQAKGWSNPLTSLIIRAMRMQQHYFRSLAKAFRDFNLDRSFSAAGALISISFAYGIFHAVGPGHGKVIVSSYLLADGSDVKRGIALVILGSLAQAVTAIVAVGLLAIILGLTHHAVAEAVPTIERISFLFVIGIGAVLVWRALRNLQNHSHHDHGAHNHDHASHSHDGHAHLPTPAEIRAIHGWRDTAAIVLAVGLRPCTGAVLVLLFALAQNAFLIGALSSIAMSIGTAITVSTLAVLTVMSRGIALRIVKTADNRWTKRIEISLKVAGGLFILTVGMLMLASSFLLPPQPLM